MTTDHMKLFHSEPGMAYRFFDILAVVIAVIVIYYIVATVAHEKLELSIIESIGYHKIS